MLKAGSVYKHRITKSLMIYLGDHKIFYINGSVAETDFRIVRVRDIEFFEDICDEVKPVI